MQINWASFHLWVTCIWAALLIPTLLWWRESIIWIVIMSWYAIVVGHWGAYQAARVEDKGEDDGRLCDTCPHSCRSVAPRPVSAMAIDEMIGDDI